MSAIPLIEISGADARERGRSYGEQARAQIDIAVDFYAQSFTRTTGLTWDQVLDRVPAWTPLIEDYLPGIMDEIEGIAEGSGHSVREILALNGRGELSRPDVFAAMGGEFADTAATTDKQVEGCSSFAILPEANPFGHVFAGQNWDWRHGIADTVLVMRIVQPDKPTIICQVEAGQVGRHGANSAGLALNANGIGGTFGKGLGVPGPFVRRKVLESWTMYDALGAAFRVRQGFNTNLLMSHRDDFAIDIETTSGRHNWMYPTDGMIVHANHFQAGIPPQINDTYKPFAVDSLYRVPKIEAGLRRARSAQTIEEFRAAVRATMSDHFARLNSVCCHPDPRDHELDRYSTVISSLVDLTSGEYLLTHGVPCENPYQMLPWNVYDGPSEPADGLVAAGVPAGATEECS
jgi:isopenicillin-N N-acyltransferase-like protein